MDILNKFNFIGEYFRNDAGEVDVKSSEDKLSNKKNRLVYLFVVEDKVKYVGSTKRGYKRPLQYHSKINKKHKLRKVHSGIKEVLDSGRKIQVYARVFNNIEFEDLSLNLFLAYEEALIEKFGADLWNKQKNSKKVKSDGLQYLKTQMLEEVPVTVEAPAAEKVKIK